MLLISLCCLTWKERRGRGFWRWFWIQWNFVFIFFSNELYEPCKVEDNTRCPIWSHIHDATCCCLPPFLCLHKRWQTTSYQLQRCTSHTQRALTFSRLPLTTSEVFGDKENSRTRSDPISRSSVAAETVGRSFQKLTQLTQRVQNGFKPFSQLTTVMPLLI